MKKKIALCLALLCSIFVNAQNAATLHLMLSFENSYILAGCFTVIECWTMNPDSTFSLVDSHQLCAIHDGESYSLQVDMPNIPTDVPLWIRAYLQPCDLPAQSFGIYYYENATHWQQATPYVLTTPISNTPTLIPIILPAVSTAFFSDNTINGMVMNEQGQGVPNTVVTAYNEAGEIVGFTTTDSNGNYHFDYLPSGEITVQVEVLGIHSETHQLVFPDDDNTFNNVNFILTDQTAIYTAVSAPLPPTSNPPMASTLTQANGSLYLNNSTYFPIMCEIVDLQGKTIVSNTIAANSENSLPSPPIAGMYFLRWYDTNQNRWKTQPFVVQ
jgi:hypothetical protein